MPGREEKRAKKLVENFGRFLSRFCRDENPRIHAGNYTVLDEYIQVELVDLAVDSQEFRDAVKKFSNTSIVMQAGDSGGMNPYALIPTYGPCDSESDSDGDQYTNRRRRRRKKNKELGRSFFSTSQILVLISIAVVGWLAVAQVKQLSGYE